MRSRQREKARHVPLLLVVPVGPGPGQRLGALEILDSARAFLQGPYRVIIVDDSGEIATWLALARYPEVDLLRNWRRRGLQDLLASLQRGYRHALTRYEFEAILRMDTDALITGPAVDVDILAFLRDHRNVGILGSRSWPDRNDAHWARRLDENLTMWGPLIEQAERRGYQRGESVLGGAYVISRRCLDAFDAQGFLRLTPSGPRIAEDVIFSLCARALGYDLSEFAGPTQPFALAWRGLPMPPTEILARGKTVTHSVKFEPEDLRSRTIFRRARRRKSRTGDLAHRTARLAFWLRWRPAATRALREKRRHRARRIFRTCTRVVPGEPEAWLGLAASLLPWWVFQAARLARSSRLRSVDPPGRP